MGLNDGGLDTGTLVAFIIELGLCVGIPIIYVGTRTWWSTRSVAKTALNIFIALFIQLIPVGLVLLFVLISIHGEEMYYSILRSLPV
jgi:hypothetical protein